MNKINLIRELEKYPVFTLETLRKITGGKRDYTKLLLHRLKNEGIIFRIEKNKYSAHEDPMLVASNITWPSYLSFWTALRFHNLTEQLPRDIFVLTSRPKKNMEIEFMGTKISFTKANPRYFFGFKKEKYSTFNIFVADAEKAVVDSVLLRKISFSEISGIIKENPDAINPEKIIEYSLRAGDNPLLKRFGFLFDSRGMDFSKKIGVLNQNYIPLEYALPPEGEKNKKWRIIENVRL